MMLVSDSLTESIELDFREACLELDRARAAWRAKDTPAARRRLAQCVARVDAILDMWNAAVAERR